MEKIKLKPCRYCGKTNIAIERWSSGGMMYMVKCNNTDWKSSCRRKELKKRLQKE